MWKVYMCILRSLRYKPEGHVFNKRETYGYKFFRNQHEFKTALQKLYEDEILPAIPLGLSATVYTQLSDVEDETNGIISYDRKFVKTDNVLKGKYYGFI